MNAIDKIVQEGVQGAIGTPEQRASERVRFEKLVADTGRAIANFDAAQRILAEQEKDAVFIRNNVGDSEPPAGSPFLSDDPFIRANDPYITG